MKLKLLYMIACLSCSATANSWAGVDWGSQGLGARLGVTVMNVPLIGPAGIEASLKKAPEQSDNSKTSSNTTRLAAGVTLRDFSLPLLPLDVFTTVGLAYQDQMNLYGEAGLSGSLIGGIDWRGFVGFEGNGKFNAGLGLEIKF